MPDAPEVHASSNTPLPSQRKPSRVKRKIFLTAALVVLAVIGSASFQKHVLKERVEARRRELIAQGEKLTLAELAPDKTRDAQAFENGAEFMDAAGKLPSIESSLITPTNDMFWPVLWRWNGFLENMEAATPKATLWQWMSTNLSQNQVHIDRMARAVEQPGFAYAHPFEIQTNWVRRTGMAFDSGEWIKRVMLYQLHENNLAEAARMWRIPVRFLHLRSDCDDFDLNIFRGIYAQRALSCTWQALQHPGWTDAQLAGMQADWEAVEYLGALEHALAGCRAEQLETIIALRRSFAPYGDSVFNWAIWPTGTNYLEDLCAHPRVVKIRQRWEYQKWKTRASFNDELAVMDTGQTALKSVRSLHVERLDFQPALREIRAAVRWTKTQQSRFSGFHNARNGFQGIMEFSFRQAAERSLAITAIAITRHRQAHGRLPASLDALVPEYLPKQPIDPMDGNPLRYRVNSDGTFLLYSVGFDGKDDGGKTSANGVDDLPWAIPTNP